MVDWQGLRILLSLFLKPTSLQWCQVLVLRITKSLRGNHSLAQAAQSLEAMLPLWWITLYQKEHLSQVSTFRVHFHLLKASFFLAHKVTPQIEMERPFFLKLVRKWCLRVPPMPSWTQQPRYQMKMRCITLLLECSREWTNPSARKLVSKFSKWITKITVHNHSIQTLHNRIEVRELELSSIKTWILQVVAKISQS